MIPYPDIRRRHAQPVRARTTSEALRALNDLLARLERDGSDLDRLSPADSAELLALLRIIAFPPQEH